MKFLESAVEGCRTRYRFIVYSIVLFSLFTEQTARFISPLAMIGGMVKEDCNDPTDNGTFCWSESTKALVLGAYFYGYTAQFLITFVAKRLGFVPLYRFWLLMSAVLQFCYPLLAGISPFALIASQVIRGMMTGVCISHNFYFARTWTIENESKGFISSIGVTCYLGNGVGPLLAGLVGTKLGWHYSFYLNGGFFLLAFCLHCTLVKVSPQDSRFMGEEEKKMYAIQLESRKYHEEVARESKLDLKNILGRVYLWAFSIYIAMYNFIYYNLYNTAPFYLNKVLKADAELISYLSISLAFLAAVCTIIASKLFQTVDKYLPWIKCRMLFILLPMVFQVIFFVLLPFVSSTGAMVVITFTAITCSTLFSGSIITANYEIDPLNSAVVLSIFNSFGQVGGFLGPLFVKWITTIAPDTANYEEVYKTRWSYFFFMMAGFAALGFISILAAYFARPVEWIDRSIGKIDFNESVNKKNVNVPNKQTLETVKL